MTTALIVDDSIFMRKMLKDMLARTGITTVIEAGDGSEAYDMYTKHKPDMVTMDITMPVEDGLSSMKRIMQYDPKAEIIMVSAMGQQSFVLDAINHGAKDFLVKPLIQSRVSEALSKLTKSV